MSGRAGIRSTVGPYVQFRELLDPVRFAPIDITKDEDVTKLNRLAYTFADNVGLNFDPLSNRDFLERLAFTCDNRWGLVIELITAAFTKCKMSGSTTLDVKHFVEVFAKKRGLPMDFSPFTAPDYQNLFDPATLNVILNRADSRRLFATSEARLVRAFCLPIRTGGVQTYVCGAGEGLI